MVTFYCIYCGGVFDKDEVSVPMEQPGWIWVRETCPRCHKGLDDWYHSTSGMTCYAHKLRAVADNAIRHNHVKRKGRYVGHWEME